MRKSVPKTTLRTPLFGVFGRMANNPSGRYSSLYTACKPHYTLWIAKLYSVMQFMPWKNTRRETTRANLGRAEGMAYQIGEQVIKRLVYRPRNNERRVFSWTTWKNKGEHLGVDEMEILPCKRCKCKPKLVCINDLWYAQCSGTEKTKTGSITKCQKWLPFTFLGITKKAAIENWNDANSKHGTADDDYLY